MQPKEKGSYMKICSHLEEDAEDSPCAPLLIARLKSSNRALEHLELLHMLTKFQFSTGR